MNLMIIVILEENFSDQTSGREADLFNIGIFPGMGEYESEITNGYLFYRRIQKITKKQFKL